jgi:hypothetical protein
MGRSEFGFSGFENRIGKLTRGVGLGGVIRLLDSLSEFVNDLSDSFSLFPLIYYLATWLILERISNFIYISVYVYMQLYIQC